MDPTGTSSPALGIDPAAPRLMPYDERWPRIFASLRGTLHGALGGRVLSIHHVGSTSVPGLSAKPILDVLIGVEDLAASLECVPALAGLGFEYGPEDDIEERHYFRGHRGSLRTHHLSLAEEGSAHFTNALVFRDALRESSDLAKDYERLKQRLYGAPRHGTELHRGKTEFVRGVLERRSTASRRLGDGGARASPAGRPR